MTRSEAIKILKAIRVYECYPKSASEETKEAIDMAIEALQGDMYCPNCGVRLVPENEYLEPTRTHGRPIDADALMKELSDTQPYNWTNSEAEIQEDADYSLFKSLINSAPTVQADRPHGEWIETSDGTMCSNCHRFPYDDGEYHIANWRSDFCPNCGADMRKEKE